MVSTVCETDLDACADADRRGEERIGVEISGKRVQSACSYLSTTLCTSSLLSLPLLSRCIVTEESDE